MHESPRLFPLKDVLRSCEYVGRLRLNPAERESIDKMAELQRSIFRLLQSNNKKLSDYPVSYSINILATLHFYDLIPDLDKMQKILQVSYLKISQNVPRNDVLRAAQESLELLARQNFGDKVYFLDNFHFFPRSENLTHRDKILSGIYKVHFGH